MKDSRYLLSHTYRCGFCVNIKCSEVENTVRMSGLLTSCCLVNVKRIPSEYLVGYVLYMCELLKERSFCLDFSLHHLSLVHNYEETMSSTHFRIHLFCWREHSNWMWRWSLYFNKQLRWCFKNKSQNRSLNFGFLS